MELKEYMINKIVELNKQEKSIHVSFANFILTLDNEILTCTEEIAILYAKRKDLEKILSQAIDSGSKYIADIEKDIAQIDDEINELNSKIAIAQPRKEEASKSLTASNQKMTAYAAELAELTK